MIKTTHDLKFLSFPSVDKISHIELEGTFRNIIRLYEESVWYYAGWVTEKSPPKFFPVIMQENKETLRPVEFLFWEDICYEYNHFQISTRKMDVAFILNILTEKRYHVIYHFKGYSCILSTPLHFRLMLYLRL